MDPHPTFSPIGGVYKSEQSVEIQAFKGTKVYYTIDGSTPDESSTLYKKPFTLNEGTLVRAVSIDRTGEKKYSMTMYDFDLTESIKEHIPSPDWNNQIIYFALLDRMNNGDNSNDDQGYGETNNSEETWFSGGDFKGLEEKLDYIKDLGATAIWITPPIKNQWSEGNFGGSHGYWASDFMEVDPHYGDLKAYKSFVDKAHEKGLYVIQDIVVNHVGDYFNVHPESRNWSQKPVTLPGKAPEQLPWSMNNPDMFTKDELMNNSFYNWTPPISNYNDKSQLHTYQLSNLDDMNTQNPVVRNLLKGYFTYWIDKVGIDGYRVDTVKYVEPDFFEGFAEDGIRAYAKEIGKEDFIMFGESWDSNAELNASYTQGKNGEKRLDSLFYFTLNFATRNVFGNGNATSELTEILEKRYTTGYQNPNKLVTFVDNHDMERLINSTTENLVKEAYAFIMTIPGIPQLYYGTEQGFTERRAAMFKGGFKENGVANDRDYFGQDTEWYTFLQSLTKLRKANSVFRNGDLKVIKDNDFSDGLFAYRLIEGEGGPGKEAVVFYNTSTTSRVAIDVESGFIKGSKFVLQKPSQGDLPENLITSDSGNMTIAMPGESFGIYILESRGAQVTENNNSINITSNFSETITDRYITINGSIEKAANIGIFVDGNYKNTKLFKANGSWETTLDLTSISNGVHEVVAFISGESSSEYIYSNSITVDIKKPFVKKAEVTDAELDESYTQPSNESFVHQQDIHGVELYLSGTDIRLDMTMNKTTNVWSPSINDFDHVVFNIFISDDNTNTGAKELPNLNATIPEEMGNWDYFASLAGWASRIVDSSSSPLSPSPYAEVDHDNNKVSIFIPAASIGNPKDLTNWRIYISTWDEDSGNLRALTLDGDEWVFAGGDGATSPLIMDDTEIITIK